MEATEWVMVRVVSGEIGLEYSFTVPGARLALNCLGGADALRLYHLSERLKMDYKRTVKDTRLEKFLVAVIFCLDVNPRLQV